jgi:MinD superfamily P-loop ATPase
MIAVVDQGRCNGCGRCETVCSFDAVRVVDRVAQADSAKCDGCGLCSEWCSGEAIQLVEKRLS